MGMLKPSGFPEAASLMLAWAICLTFLVYCIISRPSCKDGASSCPPLLISCWIQLVWTGSAVRFLLSESEGRSQESRLAFVGAWPSKVCLGMLLSDCFWLQLKLQTGDPGEWPCYAELGFSGYLNMVGLASWPHWASIPRWPFLHIFFIILFCGPACCYDSTSFSEGYMREVRNEGWECTGFASKVNGDIWLTKW